LGVHRYAESIEKDDTRFYSCTQRPGDLLLLPRMCVSPTLVCTSRWQPKRLCLHIFLAPWFAHLVGNRSAFECTSRWQPKRLCLHTSLASGASWFAHLLGNRGALVCTSRWQPERLGVRCLIAGARAGDCRPLDATFSEHHRRPLAATSTHKCVGGWRRMS
jgi:hypothetical protein